MNSGIPEHTGSPPALETKGEKVVFHASRFKSLVIMVLLLPLGCFIAGLALNVLQGGTQRFALVVVAALGLLWLRMLLNLFRSGPVVVVDEVGIEDMRWPFDIIAWEDIFEIKTDGRNWDRVIVRVVDEDLILSTLSALSRWHLRFMKMRGVPLFQIDFAGLRPNASQLFEYMQRHGLPRRGRNRYAAKGLPLR